MGNNASCPSAPSRAQDYSIHKSSTDEVAEILSLVEKADEEFGLSDSVNAGGCDDDHQDPQVYLQEKRNLKER
jgi:hypothetical protein